MGEEAADLPISENPGMPWHWDSGHGLWEIFEVLTVSRWGFGTMTLMAARRLNRRKRYCRLGGQFGSVFSGPWNGA